MASNTNIKFKASNGIDLVGGDIINVSEIVSRDGGGNTVTIDGDLTVTGGFNFVTNVNLIPVEDDSGIVGQYNLRWETGYFGSVEVGELFVHNSAGSNAIGTVGTNLIPTTDGLDLGNTTNEWTIYTDGITSTGDITSYAIGANGKVTITNATPTIFMKEGDVTGNNYRISVDGGAFKIHRVNDSDASPSSIMTVVNDGNTTFHNDVTISGDLNVEGNTFTIASEQLSIADAFITLNAQGSLRDAGIEIDRDTEANVSILWDETDDTWILTGDYSIVSQTGGGSGYVLVTSNSDATYGDVVTISGNTVITDDVFASANLYLTSTANSGVVWSRGASNDVAMFWDESNDLLRVQYANGTIDTITTEGIDNDSQYELAVTSNTSSANVTLTASGSDSGTDTIKFVGGGNTTVASDGSTVTITSSSATDSQYTMATTANTSSGNVSITASGGDTGTEHVKFVGANGITVNSNGTDITITQGVSTVNTIANTAANQGVLKLDSATSSDSNALFVGANGIAVLSNSTAMYLLGTQYDLEAPSAVGNVELSLVANGVTTGKDTLVITGSGNTVVFSDGSTITINSTNDADSKYVLSTTSNSSVADITLTGSGSDVGTDVIYVEGANGITVSSNGSYITAQQGSSYVNSIANTVANQGILRLDDAAGNDSDVLFIGANGISVLSNSTAMYVLGTQYTLSSETSGSGANIVFVANGTDTGETNIQLVGNDDVTITESSGVITIDSSDTTYDLLTISNTAANAALLRLSDSNNSNDTVTFTGSNGIVVSSNSSLLDIALGSLSLTWNDTLQANAVTTTEISTGNVIPGLDNTYYLGNSTLTWAEVNTTDLNVAGSVGSSLTPSTNNSYDLGSSTNVWRNVFTGDLNMSNMEGEANEVDGTHGSWTIQEGEDDLYLINRRNGKKYKFKLEEI